MSKSARDLLHEFDSQADIDDDFRLHVLTVKVDAAGEVEQMGNAQPVIRIEIDAESRECLFHFTETSKESITLSDARSVFIDDILEFEVCASQEKEVDDAFIRLDTPLIGFGENIELKVFFVVCHT